MSLKRWVLPLFLFFTAIGVFLFAQTPKSEGFVANCQQSFVDVPAVYQLAVSCLNNNDVCVEWGGHPTPDNQFIDNDATGDIISRAEFVKYIVDYHINVLGDWTLLTPPSTPFKDVFPTDTFYSYIETARQNGLVQGLDEGGCGGAAFHPCYDPDSSWDFGFHGVILDDPNSITGPYDTTPSGISGSITRGELVRQIYEYGIANNQLNACLPTTLTPTPTATITSTPTPTGLIGAGSTITVYAAGTSASGVYPTLEVLVGNVVVATIPNVQGDPVAGIFQSFPIATASQITSDDITVRFTNDLNTGAEDRNVRIDRIEVATLGQLLRTYETEDPTTYTQGTFTTSCVDGFLQKEWLNCADSFARYNMSAGYGNNAGTQTCKKCSKVRGCEMLTFQSSDACVTAITGSLMPANQNFGCPEIAEGDNSSCVGKPGYVSLNPGNPVGIVNGVDSAGNLTGWVCDGDNYNDAIAVHLYVDGDWQQAPGGLTQQVVASQPGDATVASFCSGTLNHAFTYSIPTEYRDNLAHTIFVYGINIGRGNTVLLSSEPVSFRLAN